jgi:hypothetical protein
MLEQRTSFILQSNRFTNERPSPFIDEEEALNHLQKDMGKNNTMGKIIEP